MNTWRIWACLTISVVALIGCGSEDPAPPPAPTPEATAPVSAPPAPAPTGLGGRVWLLSELGGAALELPSDARQPTIEFDTAASAAHGFAGCNTFRGGYKEGNGALRLGPFAVTRMACPGRDETEQRYLAAMAQTQTFRVSADSLEFVGADGAVLVRFTPQPS